MEEVHMPPDAKHALITGSSRGIGRGIALKLAEQRVKIAIHYYKNERAANDTLAEVRKRDSDGFSVQPGVDGEQRLEHAAASGPGPHPELARARVDAHGAAGNAGRRRQRRSAHVLGAGCLDNGAGDLRGWRCLFDESRGPSRDTVGLDALP